MKTLADRIEQLSPAKRALLERLRREQGGETSAAARRILPRGGNGPAPLSFTQQRLWFLDQLEPQNPFYNVAAAVRLEGRLDGQILERCLREVMRRHDILRTSYVARDGQPQQLVHENRPWSLAEIDLSSLPPGQREAAVDRLATEEAQRPFDLAADTLLRATLLRLRNGDERIAAHPKGTVPFSSNENWDSPRATSSPILGVAEHVLLLTMHHIVCDGWSMGVLRQEVAALYTAYAAGQPSPLADLPLQYADYAVWQRQWLQGEVLRSQLDYWRRQLGGDPPALELPTDRPRPPVQEYRGRRLRRHIAPELSHSLRELARDEKATLFMALLAVFQTLLARYSGQQDVSVGTPIANRRPAELEPLIGFFANTLVLRTDLSGEPTFRELLARVREATLGAYAHQDLPFEKLVDDLRPDRDLSRSPLFQVMFVLQNTPLRAAEVAGLRVSDVNLGYGQNAAFDLTLNVDDSRDALDMMLVYNTDLFDEPTVARMMTAYEALLAGVVSDPDRPIGQLPMLSAEDRRRQLVDWNHTGRDFPADRCLHELFQQQAARTPDAPAVILDDQTLTYSQLDARSNRLARHLQSLGAGPETLVGICLDRSLEMIVALWGVLKAGAAYLPLDPNYPPARLAYMLDDARCPLVITRTELADALPTGQTRLVCLDRDRSVIEQLAGSPPSCAAGPENLAYVIYTSGSTGTPKGVEVTHRSVVNHAVAFAGRCDLGPGDRMLQYLSLSFDASAEEIYPTLLNGAALVLHRAPAELSGADWLDFSRRHGINVLHTPPPIWHQVVDVLVAEGASAADHLKAYVTGGEAPSPEKLRHWSQLVGPRVRFLLCYGVTEATITSTIYEAPPRPEIPAQGRVPIGRPIANCRVYVLDAGLQPVPVGVCGEMFLSGVGVARGYRNRSELSAERFLADPFDSRPGARMYRTGDRARFLPDGNIEFLGRMDDQLKIRGYRIEPGEIETAVATHPAVREAVVAVREDPPGTKRLVAYAVFSNGETITTGQLRQFLKARLPDYMIPSLLVALDAFPVTSSGKIDRAALPVPGGSRTAMERDYSPPRTPTEQQLAGIWADVLRLERVGIHDNFFELGGDSILSIQMVSRANALGLQITPKHLFLHQTIAELAAAAGTGPVLRADQGPIVGDVPLTPIQRQFLARQMPDVHHFNQSVLLEVQPGLAPEILRQAIARLVDHHDALRLRFAHDLGAPQWHQTIGRPAEERDLLRVVDLSAVAPEEQVRVMELAAAEVQASLDLAAGPLIRCAYFDLGQGEPAQDRAGQDKAGQGRAGRLLVAIHHLAVDGVSWRILLEDLVSACLAGIQRRPIELPPKTTSFQYWAQRLNEYAGSDEVRGQLDDWLSVGDGQPAPLPCDFDRPGNAVEEDTVGRAQTVTCSLTAEETRRLLHEAPHAYHTQINDVLLTALAGAMAAWTGSRRLLVDLEGHGREALFDDVDLSRTVGWFTTMFPVCLALPSSDNPGEALKAVKEQLRRIPGGGIGYGLLRWLGDPRQDDRAASRLSAMAQAEVSFNYLGQFDQLLDEASPFAAAVESTGPPHSPRQPRPHRLEVVGRVQDGRLQVNWTYGEALYRRSTIARLADGFLESLRGLIAHCLSPEAGGFTPSDFPLAGVDDDELSALGQLLGADDDDTGDDAADGTGESP